MHQRPPGFSCAKRACIQFELSSTSWYPVWCEGNFGETTVHCWLNQNSSETYLEYMGGSRSSMWLSPQRPSFVTTPASTLLICFKTMNLCLLSSGLILTQQAVFVHRPPCYIGDGRGQYANELSPCLQQTSLGNHVCHQEHNATGCFTYLCSVGNGGMGWLFMLIYTYYGSFPHSPIPLKHQ